MGVPWWSNEWLGFGAFTTVAQVHALVWELRVPFEPLRATAKNKMKYPPSHSSASIPQIGQDLVSQVR